MEWLTYDNVELTIGGGNISGDEYNMYADTDEIKIKNVAFYDVMLNEEQIRYLASNPNIYGVDYKGSVGDINIDKMISVRDALLVLKHSAKIEILDNSLIKYADVNRDNNVNVSDAIEILKYSAGLIDKWSVTGIIY